MLKNRFSLYILIFLAAFLFHLFGLNQIGRTWDEQYKVDLGFIAWNRVLAADFSPLSWNQGTEHPMVAKYVYGFFMWPETIYLNGPQGPAQLPFTDLEKLKTGNYIQTTLYDSIYAVPYDYTLPRVASAFFNALAVLFTVIFASQVLDFWWALLAGGLLLLTPRFVFLGQLITFESLSVFLFCLIVFFFYKLLQRPKSMSLIVLVGILCGLFFWTRYNNIIIFPFLAGWLGIHYYFHRHKHILIWKLLLIPVIAFLFGILIWPLLWHDFPKYLVESMAFHQKRLVGISFYYTKYLLVTTPLVTLFGFFIGVIWCLKKRTYWHVFALWWIFCILVTYTFFCIQLGGTRYIVILYPIIAMLAAYGYSLLLKGKWIYLLIPLFCFLVFEQVKIFPYYLDYYNQLAGGTKGAIEKNYEFSWWGEGQREAGLWINQNASNGSTIGLIVVPRYVFPRIRLGLDFKGFVDEKTNADYVVISRGLMYDLSRSFWDKYEIVYEAKADNESLVYVAKIKNANKL